MIGIFIMYVYLIYDTSSKLTKIGKSLDPDARLKMLSTANPNLKLLFYSDKTTEMELHKEYSNLRVSGEWFKLDKCDFQKIIGSNKNLPKTFFYCNTYKKIKARTIAENPTTITMSTTYELMWQLKGNDHYKFSKCGKCINSQRGKEVKQVMNGRCIGYCIRGKFQSLTSLRQQLELIPKINCPF